jgi:hypothetical protein
LQSRSKLEFHVEKIPIIKPLSNRPCMSRFDFCRRISLVCPLNLNSRTIEQKDPITLNQQKTCRNNFDLLLPDIIVCLHADKLSPIIGLRNFVMPLRASSFHRHELPIIIFVTDLQYIKNEWNGLSTFPDIYILNVSCF